MLKSTLQSKYSETLALKRDLPKKTFSHSFDKTTANKYSRLGNELLNKQDNIPEALKAYETAYSYDQSSSEINGSFGYVLFRNGHFEKARDMVIESLEVNPGYGAAWFVLGQVFGYLKQEDYAYASFVNTCLFTKNINTTIGFLEREKEKYGEICVQNAAAKALETCRKLAQNNASASGIATPPPSPTTTPSRVSSRKIGKIDLQKIVFSSKQLPVIMANVGQFRNISEKERSSRMEEMLYPLLNAIRDTTRGYAKTHGYQIVILAAEERKLRQGNILTKRDLPLAETDSAFLDFLNSNEGRPFRKTVVIDDLTQTITALVNGR
jgi:tetratricopeptide (TPR) repeat protein